MPVAYMANVGTRDLTLHGQPLAKPRPDGEALLAQYDQVREQLDAPILRPGVKHAMSLVNRLEWLILFVSNQPEFTHPNHRERDTIFLGELLRRWLIEHEEFGNRVGTIIIEPLPGNPADYNAIPAFFARRLPQLVAPEATDLAYVAPVGGADASNVGLWLAAVRTYKRKCQLIYVMPDGTVEALALHRVLLMDHARHQADILLSQHNYAALGLLVEEEQLGPPWLAELSIAAHHWLQFDFQRAQQALDKARARAHGEARFVLDRLGANLQDFQKELSPPIAASPYEEWGEWLSLQRWLISELLWNLSVKQEQQEWVDFLGRLFRLHEALLRLCFEEETRHSTEKQGEEAFADFVAGVEKDQNLVAYLCEKGITDFTPTTHVLGRALDFWVEWASKGNQYGKVQTLLRTIERLSELRNKSIIAHGYRGISRNEIEEIVPLKQLWKQLSDALRSMGVPVANESSPFTEVRDLLRRGLSQAEKRLEAMS